MPKRLKTLGMTVFLGCLSATVQAGAESPYPPAATSKTPGFFLQFGRFLEPTLLPIDEPAHTWQAAPLSLWPTTGAESMRNRINLSGWNSMEFRAQKARRRSPIFS